MTAGVDPWSEYRHGPRRCGPMSGPPIVQVMRKLCPTAPDLKRLGGLAALGTLALGLSPARAADLPLKAPALAPPFLPRSTPDRGRRGSRPRPAAVAGQRSARCLHEELHPLAPGDRKARQAAGGRRQEEGGQPGRNLQAVDRLQPGRIQDDEICRVQRVQVWNPAADRRSVE